MRLRLRPYLHGECRIVSVTESLVDAKDEARQAEVRTEIARALHSIERALHRHSRRLARVVIVAIGIGVAINVAFNGLIVALLSD